MDEPLLRLSRMGPLALGLLIAVGAAGGLALDVLTLGGLDAASRGLPVMASLVAVMGMVLSLRNRAAGLALALGGGLAVTALAFVLGTSATPGYAEMGSLWVLVASTVRNDRPARAVTGAVAVFIGVALASLRLYADDGGASVMVTVLLWFPVVIAIGVGLWFRYLDETGERMAADARREERLALARELHDTVAHHVTGIVVQAQAAGVVVDGWARGTAQPRPEVVAGSLAAIEASGAETMAAMRRFVGTLRGDEDAPLAPTSGLAELRDLVASVSATGPRVRLSVDEQAVPPDVAPTVFRVVQESLTNVRQHAADATRVTVDIGADQGWLATHIRNDGGPPVLAVRSGFGLEGLRERLVALGGELRAGPVDGGGWLVSAWIPLR